MPEQSKTSILWNIGGCLFTLSRVVWTAVGNIPIGMMNVAVGVLFTVIGASKARGAKRQQGDMKDDHSKPRPGTGRERPLGWEFPA